MIPGGSEFKSGEYWFLNPNRTDKNRNSFSVNPETGAWHDFASGDSGRDLISLWGFIKGIDYKEAANDLVERYSIPHSSSLNVTPKKTPPTEPEGGPPQFIMPVPDNAPNRPVNMYGGRDDYGNPIYRKIDFYADYRDQDGNLLFYYAREERGPDMPKKALRPLSLWRKPNGSFEWRERLKTPRSYKLEWLRPFYRLEMLAKNPNARVLLVEGEVKCDLAQKALRDKGWVVVSLCGGKANYRNMDVGLLKGRDVVCWPDNDKEEDKEGNIKPFEKRQAYKAMSYIAEQCGGAVMVISDDYPDKWDVADAIRGAFSDGRSAPKIDNLIAFIEEHARKPEPPPPLAANDNEPSVKAMLTNNEFYTLLGYQHNDGVVWLYFYNKRGRGLVYFKHNNMSEAYMNAVAPFSFFQAMHPDKSECKNPYPYIARTLISIAYEVGYYKIESSRGRGMWQDGNRYILHMGDSIIDGKEKFGLTDFKSRHLYESRPPIDIKSHIPLTAQEGIKIYELLCKFPWERDSSALFLLGWIFLAPICGAMLWRPHIWIYGEAGTGKSWLLENIVTCLLGPMHFYAKSNSTEAGLRHEMKNDALPVVFDEAESDNTRTQENMVAVVELMRQASSRTKAAILKGSSSGNAVKYNATSSFCFASIKPAVDNQADRTRVAMLSLIADKSEEGLARFEQINRAYKDIITDDTPERLLMRGYNRIIDIIKAVDIFQARMALKLGGNRSGDQYGTLLAGAWCAQLDDVPTVEQADMIISGIDWEVEREELEQTDSMRCLTLLLQHKLRIQIGIDRPIYYDLLMQDLIHIASGRSRSEDYRHIDRSSAQIEIRKFGILTDGQWVYIANSSVQIRNDVLRGTAWAINYNKVLKNLSGAMRLETPKQIFMSGAPSRGIKIPVDTVLGQAEVKQIVLKEIEAGADNDDIPKEWKKEL